MTRPKSVDDDERNRGCERPGEKCRSVVKITKEAAHLSGVSDGAIWVCHKHRAIGALCPGFDPIAGFEGYWMKPWDPALIHPAARDHFLKNGGKRQDESQVDDDVEDSEAQAFENVIVLLHVRPQ